MRRREWLASVGVLAFGIARTVTVKFDAEGNILNADEFMGPWTPCFAAPVKRFRHVWRPGDEWRWGVGYVLEDDALTISDPRRQIRTVWGEVEFSLARRFDPVTRCHYPLPSTVTPTPKSRIFVPC